MVSTCLLPSFDGCSRPWTVLDRYRPTNFIFFASTHTGNKKNWTDVKLAHTNATQHPKSNLIPPRNPLQLDIIGKRRPRPMNLKNTSNFPLKISMPVIQFSGGWVDVLSSQICFALLVISYAFLVSCSYTFILFLHETSSCQVLLLPLSRSSQVVGTLFPSAVQASMLIPSASGFWC